MDKPEETEPAPPRRRGNLFSWFVLLLAIPIFYLASAGPVIYVAGPLADGHYIVGTGDFRGVVW